MNEQPTAATEQPHGMDQPLMLLEEMTPEQRRDARLQAVYGITLEQYNQMLVGQGGKCLICHRPPAPSRLLVVDHNHETGVVRGLLCSECNTGIGLLGDDPANLQAAIDYLNAHGDYPRGETPHEGTDPAPVSQTHPVVPEAMGSLGPDQPDQPQSETQETSNVGEQGGEQQGGEQQGGEH